MHGSLSGIKALKGTSDKSASFVLFCFVCCVCVGGVLGLELKDYTLSYSPRPFFVKGFFEIGSC
jgi:hypothetical protein